MRMMKDDYKNKNDLKSERFSLVYSLTPLLLRSSLSWLGTPLTSRLLCPVGNGRRGGDGGRGSSRGGGGWRRPVIEHLVSVDAGGVFHHSLLPISVGEAVLAHDGAIRLALLLSEAIVGLVAELWGFL